MKTQHTNKKRQNTDSYTTKANLPISILMPVNIRRITVVFEK